MTQRIPSWLVFLVLGLWLAFLIMLALLVLKAVLPASAQAQQICDFEHQCYPDGGVNHPIPHIPVQPPQPVHQPAPRVCHLMTMRFGPTLTTQIVELCSMSPEEEAAVHVRVGQ